MVYSAATNTGAGLCFQANWHVLELGRVRYQTKVAVLLALLPGDHFGESVSLDGDRLAVGAVGDDGHNNSHPDAGATYIFGQNGDSWDLDQEIDSTPEINNDSWQYFKTPNSTEPTCDSSGDSKLNTVASANKSITAAAADHGKWICFKAKNVNGIARYTKIQVDVSPTIAISQDQDSVDATAQSVLVATITSSSWQNFKTDDTTKPSCDSSDIAKFNTASSSNNAVIITSSDNNKWVCFKVLDSNNLVGYAAYQIDYNPPIVSIKQDNTKLTASSRDDDLPATPAWQKSGPHSGSDCGVDTTGFSTGKIVTGASNNKYYCFKVVDKAGNVGYGELQVDLTAPTNMILSQSSSTIVAKGTGLSNFAYFTSATDPTCSSTNTTTYISGAITTTMTDGHWVCFKATNNRGVWGYAKLQINLSAPTVTLTQNGTTVTASGTGLTDFSYFWSLLRAILSTLESRLHILAERQFPICETIIGFVLKLKTL